MNAKNGFILVIVEGNSDQAALEPILNSIYNRPNSKQRFKIVFLKGHDRTKRIADLTTHGSTNSRNIFGRINKFFIEPWLNNNHYTPDIINKVIHVVDMDGAYIDDSCIKYDPNRIDPNNTRSENLKYCEREILSANIEQTKIRNAQKRNNLDWLAKNSSIHYKKNDEATGEITDYNINYEVYFFSCNLDHVLHHDANLILREKVKKAELFAKQYGNKPEDFIKAIGSSALTDMTYEESWDFIAERGNHSLEPHTNINILLERIENDHITPNQQLKQ